MKLGTLLSFEKSTEEQNKTSLSKTERRGFAILWIIAFIVNIKMIFFSYCTDSAYTVVMADRLLKGDRLFFEMWEPHQTSAILPYFLEVLYRFLFHTMDGVVVWLHVWGMLFFLGGALLMICLWKPYLPAATLQSMALLTFVMRPKFTNMPDYANMSVLFALLLWVFLVKYLFEKKYLYLVLCVLSGCAATFAYPSNLLLLAGLFVLLLFSQEKRLVSCAVVVAVCGLVFGGFALFVCIASGMNIVELLQSLSNIFLSDTHSQLRYMGWPYISMVVYGCVFLGIVVAVSCLLKKWFEKKGKKVALLQMIANCLIVLMPLCSIVMMLISKKNDTLYDWFYFYLILPAFSVGCGIAAYRKQQGNSVEKKIFLHGQLINLGVFLGTCILTDLPLITVMGYMTVGVVAGFILLLSGTVEEQMLKRGAKRFVVCVFLVISMHQFFLASDASGMVSNLFGFENYVRVGPEKYLGSKLAYCNEIKYGMPEWVEHVGPEDAVLLIGDYPYELTAYMYSDAKVSNFSAISTPSFYEDMMMRYWEKFPDRQPTVIAIQCYLGEEKEHAPQWLRAYMESFYEAEYIGRYWNFYTRK